MCIAEASFAFARMAETCPPFVVPAFVKCATALTEPLSSECL